METKNSGYKAGILSLVILLILCNAIHIVRYNDADEEYVDSMSVLLSQLASIRALELIELDHFTNELDYDYISILSIEPIGFINYSSGRTGFRTIMYNVTFDFIYKEEVNGSIELWLINNTNITRNRTDNAYMVFDVAIANDQEPMKEGNIYKFYYIYNVYRFFNVIYYEKIETGRAYRLE